MTVTVSALFAGLIACWLVGVTTRQSSVGRWSLTAQCGFCCAVVYKIFRQSVVGRFQMVGAGVLEDCLVTQSREIQKLTGGAPAAAAAVGDALDFDAKPTTLHRKGSDAQRPTLSLIHI